MKIKRKHLIIGTLVLLIFIYDRYKPSTIVYLKKMTGQDKYNVTSTYVMKNPSLFRFNSLNRFERQIKDSIRAVKSDNRVYTYYLIDDKNDGMLDDPTPYEELNSYGAVWWEDKIGAIEVVGGKVSYHIKE